MESAFWEAFHALGMLMRTLGVVLWILVIALALGSAHYCQQDCHQYSANYQSCQETCPTIDGIVWRAITAYIGDHIDEISSAITALATVAVGFFTWTIWRVNKRQLSHSHEIERAYVSGGGVPHAESTPHTTPTGQIILVTRLTGNFELHINNHEKTTARLQYIAIEFCEESAMPPEPIYHRVYKPDFIGPGTQSGRYDIFLVPTSLQKPVVYGRLYYRDIFDSKERSCGFVQRLDMTTGGTWLIRPPSDAYTSWN